MQRMFLYLHEIFCYGKAVINMAVTPAPRHFVVGDTHGRYDLAEELIRSRYFDCTRDRVYFLGDYFMHGDRKELNSQETNTQKLMKTLNEFYCADISQPGIHLLRGNGEWKWGRINGVFGNITLSACPDIVVLRIGGYTVCLSHSGMHRSLWHKITEKDARTYMEFFLSAERRDDIYNAVIEASRNSPINVCDKSEKDCADFWPEKEDKTLFIHGHFPAHRDSCVQGFGENTFYNYRPFDLAACHGLVRFNSSRNALNIDAGANGGSEKTPGFAPCIVCVCLEDLIAFQEAGSAGGSGKFCKYVYVTGGKYVVS